MAIFNLGYACIEKWATTYWSHGTHCETTRFWCSTQQSPNLTLLQKSGLAWAKLCSRSPPNSHNTMGSCTWGHQSTESKWTHYYKTSISNATALKMHACNLLAKLHHDGLIIIIMTMPWCTIITFKNNFLGHRRHYWNMTMAMATSTIITKTLSWENQGGDSWCFWWWWWSHQPS